MNQSTSKQRQRQRKKSTAPQTHNTPRFKKNKINTRNNGGEA